MSDRVFGRLSFVTSLPGIVVLLVLCLICTALFQLRSCKMGGVKILDRQYFGYSPQKAQDILHDMGQCGRNIYAATQVSLDVVFPISYAGLFAGLIGASWPTWTARRLAVLPLIAAGADLVENGVAAYLAWTFNDQPDPIACVGSTATVTKWTFTVLSALAVGSGGVWALCANCPLKSTDPDSDRSDAGQATRPGG